MPLLNLIVVLIVIGILLWAVNTIFPMDEKIRKIINVIVTVAVCLWLLTLFTGIGDFGNINVGRHR
jgi:hypothetical protein